MASPNATVCMNAEVLNSSFGDIAGPVNSYNTQTVYVFQDGNHVEFRRFLSSLTPEEQHRAVLERLTEGTGQWFLDSNEFRGWLDPDDPDYRPTKRRKTTSLRHVEKDRQDAQVLCCVGPPGVGKSSLASRVIGRLQEDAMEDNHPVLFFYCDHQDIVRQTSTNIIGILLAQLVARLQIDNPIVQQLQTLHRNMQPLTTKESRDCLDNIIFEADFRKVYVCLDALDELNPAVRDDVLRCCLLLCSRHPTTRLFLTGRDNAGVEAAVKDIIVEQHLHILLTVFPLTVEANAPDVRLFLNEKISRDRCRSVMNPQLRDGIVAKLEGLTFLMASLRVNAVLDKQTISGRRENLEKQLTTVDEAYAQTLERIRLQGGDAAHFGMEIIRWMLFAVRRLTLSELCYAIAIKVGSGKFNPDQDLPPYSIIDFTLGLVAVERDWCGDDCPRFFHYTLQEYLYHHRDEIFPDSHAHLALVTLTYLSFDTDDARYERWDELKPFVDYAETNWTTHAFQQPSDAVAMLLLHSSKFAKRRRRNQRRLRDAAKSTIGGSLGTWDCGDTSITVLHEAAVFGLIDVFGRLIHLTVQLAGQDSTTDCLSELCVLNADVTDNVGRTPLSYAITVPSNMHTVKYLLDRGDVDPNSSDNFGRTPLHYAVLRGSKDIIELLLSRNDVNPNSGDNSGRTPLVYAAKNRNKQITLLLLSRSDIAADIADQLGRTALSHVAERGWDDVFELLLSRNDVDPDSVDNSGRTPLLYAVECWNEQIVLLLLSRSDVAADIADQHGRTALSHAAEKGWEGVLELLLSRNDVDPNSGDNSGRTPLLYAVKYWNEQIILLLLSRSDVAADIADQHGWTALFHALLERGRDDILKLLISRNDNPNSNDNSGQTLLYAVKYDWNKQIILLLLFRRDVAADIADQHGRTALSYAAESGRDDLVELLLSRNDVDPNLADNSGRTPLSYAVGHWEEIVELLLSRSDVDPNVADNSGRTPLSYAAEHWNKKTVELLLSYSSVAVEMADKSGRTPLSYAGSRDIAEILLSCGNASANIVDKTGRTPLSYAADKGSRGVVELLLSRGNADMADKTGRTPLSYAAEVGNSAIVELLLAQHDVVADSADNNRLTPLSYAARHWSYRSTLQDILQDWETYPDLAMLFLQGEDAALNSDDHYAKIVELLLKRISAERSMSDANGSSRKRRAGFDDEGQNVTRRRLE